MRAHSALLVVTLGTSLGCSKDLEHVRPKGDTGTSSPEDTTPAGTATIRINEVHSRAPAFVEVINIGDVEGTLAGWTLESDSGCRFPFPDDGALSAGGRLAIWEGAALDCRLQEADALQLVDHTGTVQDSTSWVEPLARRSWCRIPDGSGSFTACSGYTPDDQNEDVDEGEVLTPVWTWTWDGAIGSMTPREDGLWVVIPDDGGLVRLSIETGEQLELRSVPAFVPASDGAATVAGLTTSLEGELWFASPANAALSSLDLTTGEPTRILELGEVAPYNLTVLDDGTVLVGLRRENQVNAYTADLLPRWDAKDGEDGALTGPRQLAGIRGLALIAATESGTVAALDLATGERRGSITAPATADVSDEEPGTVDRLVGGMASLADPPVVLIADPYRGAIMVFDASDTERLLDPDQQWGFLGAVGQLGVAPGEFAYIRSLLVLPDAGLLVVKDDLGERLQAFSLAEVLERATP